MVKKEDVLQLSDRVWLVVVYSVQLMECVCGAGGVSERLLLRRDGRNWRLVWFCLFSQDASLLL